MRRLSVLLRCGLALGALALSLDGAAQPPGGPSGVRIVVDPEGIRIALEMYRQALERKDIALLRQVRPDLSTGEIQKLERSFDDMESLQVSLTVESMALTADRAEVRGLREDAVTTKAGQTMRNQAPFVYRLKETPSGWIFVRVE
jgi:hypothetical protein